METSGSAGDAITGAEPRSEEAFGGVGVVGLEGVHDDRPDGRVVLVGIDHHDAIRVGEEDLDLAAS